MKTSPAKKQNVFCCPRPIHLPPAHVTTPEAFHGEAHGRLKHFLAAKITPSVKPVREPQFRKIVGIDCGGNQALVLLSNLVLD